MRLGQQEGVTAGDPQRSQNAQITQARRIKSKKYSNTGNARVIKTTDSNPPPQKRAESVTAISLTRSLYLGKPNPRAGPA